MKYEKEIKKLLSDVFRESWMNESDWQEFLSDDRIIVRMNNISKDIEEGIKNGYTVDEQIAIVKFIFK
ncbi:MAG: hypothetical protein WC979_02830 [Candidatus Pacearchaeota archaeon]|jgi:hypothetical protein|nr:hypothetical protein [Clostridia bacterium]